MSGWTDVRTMVRDFIIVAPELDFEQDSYCCFVSGWVMAGGWQLHQLYCRPSHRWWMYPVGDGARRPMRPVPAASWDTWVAWRDVIGVDNRPTPSRAVYEAWEACQ